MNGRELSTDEEALLPHSDVTVILDSGSSAARRLTNGTFSQFGQLISWANFFQNQLARATTEFAILTRYFGLLYGQLESKAKNRKGD